MLSPENWGTSSVEGRKKNPATNWVCLMSDDNDDGDDIGPKLPSAVEALPKKKKRKGTESHLYAAAD